MSAPDISSSSVRNCSQGIQGILKPIGCITEADEVFIILMRVEMLALVFSLLNQFADPSDGGNGVQDASLLKFRKVFENFYRKVDCRRDCINKPGNCRPCHMVEVFRFCLSTIEIAPGFKLFDYLRKRNAIRLDLVGQPSASSSLLPKQIASDVVFRRGDLPSNHPHRDQGTNEGQSTGNQCLIVLNEIRHRWAEVPAGLMADADEEGDREHRGDGGPNINHALNPASGSRLRQAAGAA